MITWPVEYGSGKNVHEETIADAGESLKIKWFTDSYLKAPFGKRKNNLTSKPRGELSTTI